MTQDQKSNLGTANELFRQGNYSSALTFYQLTIMESPNLSAFIKYNIEICKNKLKINGCDKEISIESSASNISEIKALLETSIDGIVKFPMPTKAIIRLHLQSLEHPNPGLQHLKASILCALASPYQRALLTHLNWLIEKLDLKKLLDQKKQFKNCLITLILLATHRTYWLMNRCRIKSECINCTDRRFIELLQSPPKTNDVVINENHVSKNYTWEPLLKIDYSDVKSHPCTKITFGTILLNEAKFIGMNLIQHYDFCDQWILVEGACQGYPTRKVTSNGLSMDNSASQILIFPDPLDKIRLIQHGWTKSAGENAKSELRNQYIKYCKGEFLVVVDADEFYIHDDLKLAIAGFEDPKVYAITLPQIHFWKNINNFITGEYYDIAHTRIYRYIAGMKYITNHNFPEIGGKTGPMLGHKKIPRTMKKNKDSAYRYEEPCCYHMGFAKDADDMRDKSDYYINRGEATTRPVTTSSRDAWFTDNLPEKCAVYKWNGALPEVLDPLKEAYL